MLPHVSLHYLPQVRPPVCPDPVGRNTCPGRLAGAGWLGSGMVDRQGLLRLNKTFLGGMIYSTVFFKPTIVQISSQNILVYQSLANMGPRPQHLLCASVD